MAALAAAFGVSTTAGATPPGGVVEYPSVSYIQSQTGMISAPFILVDDYTNIGDGGGGYFTLVDTASYCKSGATHNLQDGGVTIGDSALNTQPTHCYLRRFTGPVHLKWYGIASQTDGTSASSTVTALNNALAVAAAANPGVTAAANRAVDTDGVRIYVNQSIEIPADVRLTCDATPGGLHQAMSHPDYSITPASIIFTNPASPATLASPLITMTDALPLHDDNTELDHCILLTTGNTSDMNSNIILNPDTVPHGMQNVRNMVGNGSTAISCTAGACNIHDNLIIGFDTAIEGKNAPHLKLTNNNMDANVGVFLTSTGSPAVVDGFEMDSFLTEGLENQQYVVSNVTGGTGGVCRIYVNNVSNFTPMTGGNYATGDSVAVGGIIGPVNCNGRATVSAKNSGANWIELADTKFLSPSEITASWSAGSSVISVDATTASKAFTGVWAGLGVQCSGGSSCPGLPAGAAVVDVSTYNPYNPSPMSPYPTRYKVVINKPLTAAASATSIDFTNATYSSSGVVYLYPSLRPRAGTSEGGQGTYNYGLTPNIGNGTCIQAGTDSDISGLGIKIVNAQCFGHEVDYAFSGANPGGCVNCSSDRHVEVQDINQIGILVRGSQSGNLGFVNSQIDAGGGAVVDEYNAHCANFDTDEINPSTPGSLAFLAVNGCFTASGTRGNLQDASDWLLEIGSSEHPVSGTITGSDAPKTKIYNQDQSVAQAVSCANNLFLSSSCENALPSDLSLVATANAPSCGLGCHSVGMYSTNNAMSVTSEASVSSERIAFAGPGFAQVPTCVVSRTGTDAVRAAVTEVATDHIKLGFSAAVTSETDYVVCIGH